MSFWAIKFLFNVFLLFQFLNTFYFKNNLLKSFRFLNNFYLKFNVYFRNLKQFHIFFVLFIWVFGNFLIFGFNFLNFLIIFWIGPASWLISFIFKFYTIIKFWKSVRLIGFSKYFGEIISIFSRSGSLTLRLFVNLFVGFLICHFLQFGKNVENLGYFNFLFTSFFILFEVFIIYIQSFIFSFLVRSWLIEYYFSLKRIFLLRRKGFIINNFI